MDVTAISRSGQVLAAAPAEIVRPDQAAENRDVVSAVKALNQTEMFGQDNQLTFQRDTASQRMVLRIVNRSTGEIISQIPPEYVLRLAEGLRKR